MIPLLRASPLFALLFLAAPALLAGHPPEPAPTCDAATQSRLEAAVKKACQGTPAACGAKTSCPALKRGRVKQDGCFAAHEEVRRRCFPGALGHFAQAHRAAAQSAEMTSQRCQVQMQRRLCK